MTEFPFNDIVLKIFSGLQAGVEVGLSAGEYSLGSGDDDDIHVIDVSLTPGHARLRIAGGRIEIAGGTGSVRTTAGLVLEAGGAWHEVEPLDILTAGTTRFALGYANANWASIAGAQGDFGPRTATVQHVRNALITQSQARALIGPALAFGLLLGAAGWYVTTGGRISNEAASLSAQADLSRVRTVLNRFPFGQRIEARQEVDGAIYVAGYVETSAERRALLAALEQTGMVMRVRLWVLQVLRSEVQNLIASQKVNVTGTVNAQGQLVLDGLILDPATAARFAELVKSQILGLAVVESQIRTSADLLIEVEKLAVSTQVQPWILLRADNDRIEANGAIPATRIDAWVGFLQSYARRFSKDIPLRSFVQLQGVNRGASDPPQAAIVVGAVPKGADIALDVERLNLGAFRLDDVFAGRERREGIEAQDTPRDLGLRPTAPADPQALMVGGGGARVEVARGDRAKGDGGRLVTPTAGSPTERTNLGATQPSNGRDTSGRVEFAPTRVLLPSDDAFRAGRSSRPAEDRQPHPAYLRSMGSSEDIALQPKGPYRPEEFRDRGALASDRPRGFGQDGDAVDFPRPAGSRNGIALRSGGLTMGAVPPSRDLIPFRAGERRGADPEPKAGGAIRRPEERSASVSLLLDSLDSDRRTSDRLADLKLNGIPALPGAAVPSLEPIPQSASDSLAAEGRDLLERWRDGRLGSESGALRKALDTLRVSTGAGEGIPSWYLPLFKERIDGTPPCWPGAQMREIDIPAVLFWLDFLSASEAATLATFNRDAQFLLLEAALNPDRILACLKRTQGRGDTATRSLYLREIGLNPSFIQFLVRDLPSYSLEVAGVDLGRTRFVLTREGRKMFEGAAPDRTSRLALIGELGVAVQLSRGLSTVVFQPDLAWKIMP